MSINIHSCIQNTICSYIHTCIHSVNVLTTFGGGCGWRGGGRRKGCDYVGGGGGNLLRRHVVIICGGGGGKSCDYVWWWWRSVDYVG